MRHLSTLTNILPVIAKSDSLSHTQLLTLKLSLLRTLRTNSIPIFTFGHTNSPSDLDRRIVNGLPYAISCLRDECAEMDASLLMREDIGPGPGVAGGYVYVESDLPILTRVLVENAAWLRFSAVRKFVEWRGRREGAGDLAQSTMSLVSLPRMEGGAGGFAMARVGDHMEREERIARVRLVQWAGDMRRGIREKMTMERMEFEQVEQTERVRWLLERLNEAIEQQPATTASSRGMLVPRGKGLRRRGAGAGRMMAAERDPLGLVWWKERWGGRVQRGVMWAVEVSVVLGSGWVVWKYLVESGFTGWIMHNARSAGT